MKMINKDIKVTIILGVAITAAMSIICLFIEPVCAIITLLLGAIITGIFALYTKKRYNRLNELNNYLSAVCSGDFDLKIAENTEGELSILSNNLYKVITILRTQNEMLIKDKTYLADSDGNKVSLCRTTPELILEILFGNSRFVSDMFNDFLGGKVA